MDAQCRKTPKGLAAIGVTCIPDPSPFALINTHALKPRRVNARKHTRQQIRAIARSVAAFGFNVPILIDTDLSVVKGEACWEAAKLLGLDQVPTIQLSHLSKAQIKAYALADNKLSDRSTWDDVKLAGVLNELLEVSLEFDIEATGFDLAEIEILTHPPEDADAADRADEFEFAEGNAVSALGDTWFAGDHRIHCGNSLLDAAYADFFAGEVGSAVFADPPYNVRIDGHAGGTGKIKHREFPMASGEMTKAEYADFQIASFAQIRSHAAPGALVYICMDWRHAIEVLTAAQKSGWDQINRCIWVKSNGGLGSLYRSRYEDIYVFKNGPGEHVNNVQLGRFGRNRTNVWNYPGVTNFTRKGMTRALDYHPTVKPILLVSDAILDSTNRGDAVLDPFLGSGTTLLAATRTDRRCYGIELDPLYCDTAIERWQRLSGKKAKNKDGATFDEIKAQKGFGS